MFFEDSKLALFFLVFFVFVGFFGVGFGQNAKLETVFFGSFEFFWHRPWPTFETGNWFCGAIVFFLVFFVFVGFFGVGFGQNAKLETGFFGSFEFFWHRPWPTFEIGNWFCGAIGFFWFFCFLLLGFYGFLVFELKKNKKPKTTKNPKKTPVFSYPASLRLPIFCLLTSNNGLLFLTDKHS